MEDSVSRVAEGTSTAVQELDFSSLRAQLGPLPAVRVDILFLFPFPIGLTFLVNKGSLMYLNKYFC